MFIHLLHARFYYLLLPFGAKNHVNLKQQSHQGGDFIVPQHTNIKDNGTNRADRLINNINSGALDSPNIFLKS